MGLVFRFIGRALIVMVLVSMSIDKFMNPTVYSKEVQLEDMKQIATILVYAIAAIQSLTALLIMVGSEFGGKMLLVEIGLYVTNQIMKIDDQNEPLISQLNNISKYAVLIGIGLLVSKKNFQRKRPKPI